MKVISLSVQHVRGIHDITLEPNGENLVIWGPNGSGKSAVVDALDFLLTGEISRLTGTGTGGISLKSHGPHIDFKPSDAEVRAVLMIPNVADPVVVSRNMKNPKELVCPEVSRELLEPILRAASQHQHVLSRRELLRFITAEPASRADEIQELLSLKAIERTRGTLVTLKNQAKSTRRVEEKNVSVARIAFSDLAELDKFDSDLALEIVNKHRAILGAGPIGKLTHSELLSNLTLPKPTTGTQSINVTALDATFGTLQKVLSDDVASVLAENDLVLRKLLVVVREDDKKREHAARLGLYEAGLPLVPESGECPLCETDWPPGELSNLLEERIAASRAASAELNQIIAASDAILAEAKRTVSAIDRVIATLNSAQLSTELGNFRDWKARLIELIAALEKPLDLYPVQGYATVDVSCLLSSIGFRDELENMLERITKKFPAVSPEQEALGALKQLQVSLKSLEDRDKDLVGAMTSEAMAIELHDCFLQARDLVLGELYGLVRDRFISLYSELHSSDESGISASLEPDGAGLKLAVDFFGRGEHPPHALHSEGHQDSMGLCLYLALAEHLVGDLIELTVLDDVVMSVDVEHRRGICDLLTKHFPARQFLITTHDKTWMNQLRASGLVRSRCVWEFYKWDIDTGPYVNTETGLWARIEHGLQDGDVHSAAALLRRGSEQFFAFACDLLDAPVRFSLDGRHDLGDLMPAAVSRLLKLLSKAISAAKSWEKPDEAGALDVHRSTIVQIYERTNAERWPINPSVHFTTWENLSAQDFAPVVEAFQDLFGLFTCQDPKCRSMIRVEKQKFLSTAVRCKCGATYWNLQAKKS